MVISTGGPAIDPGERSESHQKIGGVLNVETGRAVVLSWSNSEDRPGALLHRAGFGLTQSYAFWFGDHEGQQALPRWNFIPDIKYPFDSRDRQRAQAASGGPSLPHLQAGLTSGPQVLPCILQRCRLRFVFSEQSATTSMESSR